MALPLILEREFDPLEKHLRDIKQLLLVKVHLIPLWFCLQNNLSSSLPVQVHNAWPAKVCYSLVEMVCRKQDDRSHIRMCMNVSLFITEHRHTNTGFDLPNSQTHTFRKKSPNWNSFFNPCNNIILEHNNAEHHHH